jgi:hypothetical protein
MEYVERDRERVKVKGEKYTDDGNQPILGSTASQIHNTQPLQNESSSDFLSLRPSLQDIIKCSMIEILLLPNKDYIK